MLRGKLADPTAFVTIADQLSFRAAVSRLGDKLDAPVRGTSWGTPPKPHDPQRSIEVRPNLCDYLETAAICVRGRCFESGEGHAGCSYGLLPTKPGILPSKEPRRKPT
jgi:hypothetical protein